MTDNMIELAKRAVACKGWRWSSGMLWLVKRAAPLEDYAGRAVFGYTRPHEALPVLTDAATVGCLLALVREALNVPTAHVLPSFGAWYIERDAQDGSEDNEWLHVDGVWGCGSAAVIGAKAEAETLVAALESAP